MTGRETVADADTYLHRYYADVFVPGQGVEEVVACLLKVPPVRSWVDLGAGSESLLWSVPLRADRLTAVDADPHRLAALWNLAAARRPRPAYETVLALSGRTDADFAARCTALTATVVADCLTGDAPHGPNLLPAQFDLLTQFGLFGLTAGPAEFRSAFTGSHELLTSGGWTAGANWAATDPTGRVGLAADLYQRAASDADVDLLTCQHVPVAGDPDFTGVWIYHGRKR